MISPDTGSRPEDDRAARSYPKLVFIFRVGVLTSASTASPTASSTSSPGACKYVPMTESVCSVASVRDDALHLRHDGKRKSGAGRARSRRLGPRTGVPRRCRAPIASAPVSSSKTVVQKRETDRGLRRWRDPDRWSLGRIGWGPDGRVDLGVRAPSNAVRFRTGCPTRR